MSQSRITRRHAVAALAGGGAIGLVAGCADNKAGPDNIKPAPLQLDLDDPIDLAYARQKVIGSVENEEIHSFLRFHFYGQLPGEKARPLFSMNNYIVDRWEPVERESRSCRSSAARDSGHPPRHVVPVRAIVLAQAGWSSLPTSIPDDSLAAGC